MKELADFRIRLAQVEDVPIVLELIRDLATYERAPDEVTVTEEQLVDVLFAERRRAEVLLALEGESPVRTQKRQQRSAVYRSRSDSANKQSD